MMDLEKERKKDVSLEEQKHVWLSAWLAVAQASNTLKPSTADHWADQCLEGYLKRFDK